MPKNKKLDQWPSQSKFLKFPFVIEIKQILKIEPLAQVSAIERYLVLKGFGQPATENNGSGAEDNISDTDDESMDGASVIYFILFGLYSILFSLLLTASLVVFVKLNSPSKENHFHQIFQFIR